jgi:hypothetical protein
MDEERVMKRILNRVWNFLCKVVAGIGKITRELKEALTLGDAPRNLGITTQTITTVAGAAVPMVLSPDTIAFLGSFVKSLVAPGLSWLSQHGPWAVGWIAFKLGLAPAMVWGSALATCGIPMLLLCAIRLLQRADQRLSIFATFAENLRATWDWFKSIFVDAFSFAT